MDYITAVGTARPSLWQRLMQHPVVRKLCNSQNIPLLYSVVAVTSIFYHYGAEYTLLWFLLGLILQWGVFRLLAFVDRHHLLGGALYVAVGVVTLLLAQLCITVGGDHSMFGGIFAPVGTDVSLSFMVWFFTPQSVINAFYGPYTVALFLLFSFFIATVTFYYSRIRYRILMSFSVMCFPFTIYAKEAETMPVPFIVALFVMYFVVMIYCRQMHCGDEKIVHTHNPDADRYILPEPESLTHARTKELIEMPRPELFGKGLWKAAALFVGAATILVLILPKPNVVADRGYLDTLLDMSSFSDYLLNAISGFTDSSDGGGYTGTGFSQALYYVQAQESANLRLSTYTHYDYTTDSWSADAMDRPSAYELLYDPPKTALMAQMPSDDTYLSENGMVTPYDHYVFFCEVEKQFPQLAEKYGFAGISVIPLDSSAYLREMVVNAAMYNGTSYMAPLHTAYIYADNRGAQLYQSKNGLYFRRDPAIIRFEQYRLRYLSPTVVRSEAMQHLIQNVNADEMTSLLLTLMYDLDLETSHPELYEMVNLLDEDYGSGYQYELHTISRETPQSVTDLAASLTEGLTTDYEKAEAIRQYLYSNYVYDVDYLISDTDNVETFLFENKTGVCYQFASAMTELCRAAGLQARYVEGYALAERGSSNRYPEANYVIRARHAHAFTEVYVAGYGWMSFDATAADLTSGNDNLATVEDVVNTLQRVGVVLLVTAAVTVLFLYWLLPMVTEKWFRFRYRRQLGAPMMLKAYARLKKQWQIPDADTIRESCARMQPLFSYATGAVDALRKLQSALEQVVYGECYSESAAMQCYEAYCTLCSAYRPCVKRQRKEKKQTVASAAVSGSAG